MGLKKIILVEKNNDDIDYLEPTTFNYSLADLNSSASYKYSINHYFENPSQILEDIRFQGSSFEVKEINTSVTGVSFYGGSRVTDIYDLQISNIEDHAIKTIDFMHSYNLCQQNEDSEYPFGKLTLQSIGLYGQENTKISPPYIFTYNKNFNYRKEIREMPDRPGYTQYIKFVDDCFIIKE